MIVGIGHKSRHGKDQFATYMVEWLTLMRPDLTVTKLSWAWKLKDICHQLYGHLGLRGPEFYDTEEGKHYRDVKLPKIGKTPVEIWIDMGTPAVREQVWDRTWIEWVLAQQAHYRVIICPDTRFLNEVAECDVTIRVTNPRVPDRVGKSVDNVLIGFEGWDYDVVNDLGLSELRGHANNVAASIFSKLKHGS